MKLTVWTYEGPPHVGAMRIATAMKGVHYVLHAPQGDTYADLLFTMIERRQERPPVTFTTFQARDLGTDTAEIFKTAVRQACERFQPELLLVGASCTAELIQDDPGGIAEALGLSVPVVKLELGAYQHKENWGAAETFYRLVRACAGPKVERSADRKPTCNILAPTSLGFRHRDDLVEVRRLLEQLGVEINVVAPLGAARADLARLGAADFNVVLYPEIAEVAARWLAKNYGQTNVMTVPIGVGATRDFIREVAALVHADPEPLLAETREFRAAAANYGLEPLITDDQLEVEEAVMTLQPELVLGTQMERHIAKRFGIPCAVISAPVHVQDFPARYSPQMGFEGANVIFDTWVHPLMMGLEEHLLAMFRDDFEFKDSAGPSHLGAAPPKATPVAPLPEPVSVPAGAPASTGALVWTPEAERELKKIPFFVRGKAKRNTESFAAERALQVITLETLYDAKAHFSR